MTVQELIEELKKLPQDMPVVVQYRDDGGCYDGYDEDVRIYVEDGRLKL